MLEVAPGFIPGSINESTLTIISQTMLIQADLDFGWLLFFFLVVFFVSFAL